MKREIRSDVPWAVVLHIAFTGYGVVRSLSQYGVPIVAFQKDNKPPEAKSSLIESLINFDSDEDLLNKLIDFAKNKELKPVLFITSDVYVDFYVKHRSILDGYFLIDYPSNETVSLLMNKDEFVEFALENNFLIPRSYKVTSISYLEKVKNEIVFPAIVKPYTKSAKWLEAKLDKAYMVPNWEELRCLYEEVCSVEPCLLLQEWIPGPDSNIEFCLTYFDSKSVCLANFTGAKIRQWPVGTGSTATARKTDNVIIRDDALKLFNMLEYKGFGSVEYKKHEVTNDYYIMEPTVGRPNQQSYIATANNLNMPLIAYCSLSKISIHEYPYDAGECNYVYIDEWAELASFLVHLKRGQRTLADTLVVLKSKWVFRYFNLRDKVVFFSSILKILKYLCNKVSILAKRKNL